MRSVSAIVINYRTEDLTALAVRSLLMEEDLLDVVVVDNAATPSSSQRLTERLPVDRVKVVPSKENLGFGRGVNLGAAHVNGTFLFVLNSDAELVRGDLAKLILALEGDARVGIVAPLVVDPSGRPQLDVLGEFPSLSTMVLRSNRRPSDKLDPDWVSGAAMLIRRSAFDEIGGFDPDFFMYLEDVDLCRRLRGKGWTILRVRSAQVIHQLATSSTPVEREQMYHESLVLLLKKWGRSRLEVLLIDKAHKAWSSRRSIQNSSDPGSSLHDELVTAIVPAFRDKTERHRISGRSHHS